MERGSRPACGAGRDLKVGVLLEDELGPRLKLVRIWTGDGDRRDEREEGEGAERGEGAHRG